MQRQISIAVVLAVLLAIFMLNALPGCGGGGGRQLMPPVDNTTPEVQPAVEDGAPTRNALVATMPALSSLAPGAEFDYVLSVELAEELYQLSARIAFDPAVVRPVDVEHGALLPADAVVMSRLGEEEIVPFAFTALPGRVGIQPGRGELVRVRFRLTGDPHGARAVWLVNEAEFLQLRDRIGRRLSFDLANEEVR